MICPTRTFVWEGPIMAFVLYDIIHLYFLRGGQKQPLSLATLASSPVRGAKQRLQLAYNRLLVATGHWSLATKILFSNARRHAGHSSAGLLRISCTVQEVCMTQGCEQWHSPSRCPTS